MLKGGATLLMAYRDLHGFIRALEKAGERKRVEVEVDPVLQITEFSYRTVKRDGPALLSVKLKFPPGAYEEVATPFQVGCRPLPLRLAAFSESKLAVLNLLHDRVWTVAVRDGSAKQVEVNGDGAREPEAERGGGQVRGALVCLPTVALCWAGVSDGRAVHLRRTASGGAAGG